MNGLRCILEVDGLSILITSTEDVEVSTSDLSRVSPQQTSYQILHDYLKASLLVIVHELEDNGLRGRLSLASRLVDLEAPEVFPLKLGEGKHHDGRKREIEKSSKLNNTRTKASNLELLNSADGNSRHLFIRYKKLEQHNSR